MIALPPCPKCNSELTYQDGQMCVCPECARMNGTVIPLHERFAIGEPPLHANCRCVAVLMPIVTSIQDAEEQWGAST